jgi:hypothetical protein
VDFGNSWGKKKVEYNVHHEGKQARKDVVVNHCQFDWEMTRLGKHTSGCVYEGISRDAVFICN